MAWLMAPLVAFLVTAPIRHVDGAGQQKVRLAAVAGAFYPSDPKELSAMIDGMLAQASPPPADGPIVAAVAPHAGYPYSGPVAAWTFAALKGHKYSRVVVIAPSHYVGFDFTSVYDGDAYATPLGTIPVDKEFARQLTKIGSTIRLSEQGHTPTSAGGEHAIEVQLPWLQKVLGNFELVPIVMGDQSYESSRALGVALRQIALCQGTRSRVIEVQDQRLVEGFHAFEADNGLRWTDGDADLPATLFEGFDGPMELILHIGGSTQYLHAADEVRLAAAGA